MPKPGILDLETFAIEDRPRYPPVPVGVSIAEWGKAPRYYAWGHTTENNCTWAEARDAIRQVWQNADGVVFHGGKFDQDVAETHFGLPPLPWDKAHDTLFLAYLDDPHQRNLQLKPTAQRLLGEAPEERDELIDWLIDHQPVPGVKITRGPQGEHYAMKYLPWAPAGLVGRYANGDSKRTAGLFKHLWPKIKEQGMLRAYDRERELQPYLLQSERRGVNVHVSRLEVDIALYTGTLERVDAYLLKRLKADINLDSGEQLINALVQSGLADEDMIGVTEKGALKSDKKTLKTAVKDKQLGATFAYRSSLRTCLNVMNPWFEMAQQTGGTIHTSFNQTKNPDGGTRTGRLSCTWFMNMPKEFEPLVKEHAPANWNHKRNPLPSIPKPLGSLPPIPVCRSYIIPAKGKVFIDRDYSQQEPRILAHFDGKMLMEAYQANPWIDFHDYAKAELEKSGLFYERKPVKNTNLGLIYGMGVPLLAEKNDMTVEESKRLKDAVLRLYPGLKEMYGDMRARAIRGEPIHTWGGRVYYCEEPRIIKGRIRTFDYKLVNVLVQGSAADCTKEAIIRYHKVKDPEDDFLLPVHDQNLAQVWAHRRDAGMKLLKDSMESIEFDVPMLSEGDWSPDNWAALLPYDKKGVIVVK